MRINMSKVVVGGLAAAVVMIVIGFASNMFLLGPRMQEEIKAAAPTLSQAMSGGAIAGAIITQVVVGLLLVWLYAAMRPRLGPGMGTAVKAAAVIWICGLLFYQDWVHAGLMSMTTYVMASIVEAVSLVVGAWIGGRLYTEDGAPA